MKPLVEKLDHVKMTLLTVTSTVLQTRQGNGQFSVIMSGYFGGDPVSAQLTKSGKTYEVRLMVKKGIEQDAQPGSMAGIPS